MPAGRPTKYKPEYCQKMIEFFDRKPYTINDKGKVMGCDLPFLSEFARSIGVHYDTLHEWRKQHPEFSEAFKMAKKLQEELLVKNCLAGSYNAVFGIFTAKNIFGWRDKIEHFEDDSVKPTEFNIVIGGEEIQESPEPPKKKKDESKSGDDASQKPSKDNEGPESV